MISRWSLCKNPLTEENIYRNTRLSNVEIFLCKAQVDWLLTNHPTNYRENKISLNYIHSKVLHSGKTTFDHLQTFISNFSAYIVPQSTLFKDMTWHDKLTFAVRIQQANTDHNTHVRWRSTYYMQIGSQTRANFASRNSVLTYSLGGEPTFVI